MLSGRSADVSLAEPLSQRSVKPRTFGVGVEPPTRGPQRAGQRLDGSDKVPVAWGTSPWRRADPGQWTTQTRVIGPPRPGSVDPPDPGQWTTRDVGGLSPPPCVLRAALYLVSWRCGSVCYINRNIYEPAAFVCVVTLSRLFKNCQTPVDTVFRHIEVL